MQEPTSFADLIAPDRASDPVPDGGSDALLDPGLDPGLEHGLEHGSDHGPDQSPDRRPDPAPTVVGGWDPGRAVSGAEGRGSADGGAQGVPDGGAQGVPDPVVTGLRDEPPIVDPGETVGDRFRIEQLVGRGSSADVYRALDLRDGAAVALKVVRYMTAATLDAVRFEIERELLAGLRHENLIEFVDSGADRSYVWLAMRLVDGVTLAEAPRPMGLSTVAEIGAQVAAALEYVHGLGVIHRDVKPANILVDERAERVYLADFGIAREHGDPNLTRTGLVLGTAAYLSPEQVRGRPAGTSCDVYSLGLVLLECLTGRREYPGGLVESAVARLHRTADVTVVPHDAMRDLLGLMTSADPALRPSAGQVTRRLALMSRTGR